MPRKRHLAITGPEESSGEIRCSRIRHPFFPWTRGRAFFRYPSPLRCACRIVAIPPPPGFVRIQRWLDVSADEFQGEATNREVRRGSHAREEQKFTQAPTYDARKAITCFIYCKHVSTPDRSKLDTVIKGSKTHIIVVLKITQRERTGWLSHFPVFIIAPWPVPSKKKLDVTYKIMLINKRMNNRNPHL